MSTRDLTVKVNVVAGRQDRLNLYSTGTAGSNTATPIRYSPPSASGFAGMMLSSSGTAQGTMGGRPLGALVQLVGEETARRLQAMVGTQAHSQAITRERLAQQEVYRTRTADAAVAFNQAPSSANVRSMVAATREAMDQADPRSSEYQELSRRVQLAESYATGESQRRAAMAYNQNPSAANVRNVAMATREALNQADPRSPDFGELSRRNRVAEELERSESYRRAKWDSEYQPTPNSMGKLAESLSALKQNYAPGSPEYMRAVREEIDARKQQTRMMYEERRFGLVARHGGLVGNLKYAQERAGEVTSMAGGAFAYGQASITGAVATGSPDMFLTYTRSWQLLTGEIGLAFIPAMTRASQLIQSTSRWVRDLDPDMKQTAASLAFWGTAAAGGLYAMSKLVSVGTSAVEMFGRVRSAALTASSSVGGFFGGERFAPWNGAAGVGSFVRNNPAMIGGLAGAGLTAYGMMNPNSPMASYANLAGNSLMLGSFLTPQGAGWGGLARNSLLSASALTAGDQIGRAYGWWGQDLPRGQVGTQRGSQVSSQVERRLTELDTFSTRFGNGIVFGDAGETRMEALRQALRPYNLRPEDMGLSASGLQGGLGTALLGSERIRDIARGAGVAAESGATPGQTSLRQQAIEARRAGKDEAASRLDLQATEQERNRVLWSTNFQPQQVGIENLRGMVQNELIRGPQEQEIYEQQYRGLQALTKEIQVLNATLGAQNQNAAIP